ncbi:MAG: large conductance mechanosensitive channel protein MscL [Clostridia bacterium]|nr:large conductance mechanosensitive channel protein MscL [Clostridia bacterium]
MKKFFKEFKDFITRGNVLDMAVGVIVGGAFTAIITALTSQILQPLINWLIALISGDADNGLEAAVTILKPAYVDGTLDLASSIYIDWGAFITAIINFILVAFILFCIVKAINSIRAGGKKLADKQKKAIEKKVKKGEISAEEAEQAKAEIEAPAEEAPVVAAVTTEQLLAEIRDLLKEQKTEEHKEEK